MKKLLILIIFLGSMVPLWGQTTHYVTNLGDNGPGSLRQTVAQAFPNDTIRFNVKGTIFLSSGRISIAKDLVIEGPGMDSLIITQSASNRLLAVTTTNFRLTGLTLRGGKSTHISGAGLDFIGTHLYLKDVKVNSCYNGQPGSSYGTSDRGGAVSIGAGIVMFEDCVFNSNYMYTRQRTSYGGAVYIGASQATIRRCLFENNLLKGYGQFISYRTSSVDTHGGALCLNVTGNVLIENTTFNNNRANGVEPDTRNSGLARGGAVYIHATNNVDIHNSVFSNNSAIGYGAAGGYSSYSDGGGIYATNSVDSITITNCLFDDNRRGNGKGDGGAINLKSRSIVVKQIEVLNSNSDNSAVAIGGTALFEDNYIHDNSSKGVTALETFNINRCLFDNNDGSAIVAGSANANNQIINCTFYRNTAREGAAIYAANNTNHAVNVINCTMVDNSSTTNNGALAVYTKEGTVSLKNSIITNSVFSAKPLVALGRRGGISSGGGNIIRDNSISSFLSQSSDRNATDPRLGTFANHGGRLSLFSLQSNSPAIDLGGTTTLTMDQRGFLRIGDTDAGAFEFGATNPRLPTVNVATTTITTCENTASQLVVQATGQVPLIYQWFLNGTPISGATRDTLFIGNASPTDAGIYTCEVANALDTIMSDSIYLVVHPISRSTDVQTACGSYTWIDGNTYTSSNNTATIALTNAAGCDSVVTLDLTIKNSTTSTDVQTACDSYTWIDGNTYTSSNNTAMVTLTNAAGCDSVVTLDLTIKNSATSTDVQTACDSYTWIDGNTYTSSNNTATVTLTNAAGCDSVVTLDLTIKNSTTSTDVQTACGSYTWINGNTYITSNNTATVTLVNAAGCDSVVTLDLTIKNSTTSTDVQTACGSYTWIDGNTYTSSNNTATVTLTNAAGCDSVVTLDLTIKNSTTSTDVQTACDSYTWIDGNTYTSSNNTATVTLTNAAGCDSVVTLDLTIKNSTTSTDVQTACDSYTWIDGNTYTSSNNTATVTLTNAAGCDSVVTLDLTINTVNTAVTQANTTLTAAATGATYQWIDCNNGNAPIAGATAQSFTPNLSGDYAVLITENGCTSTSTCFNVTVINVDKVAEMSANIQLYPNPTTAAFVVDLGRLMPDVTIQLRDLAGKLLETQHYAELQQTEWILENDLPEGVYIISVQVAKNQPVYLKLIKQ